MRRVFRFLTKPVDTDRLAAIIREALAEKLARERMSAMAHRVGGIASLEWNLAEGVVRWSRDAGDLFPLPEKGMPPCIEDLAELVVPEDRALFSAGVDACVLDGRCGAVRFRTRRPDGGCASSPRPWTSSGTTPEKTVRGAGGLPGL
jgi:hypothetical protein